MRMLSLQRKEMAAVSLASMMQEPRLEIGRGLVTEDVSGLLIGGGRVIRTPLGEDVEVRLGLEMMGAGLAVISWQIKISMK